MIAETRTFSLALSGPLETARGTVDSREGVLIRVDDGTFAGVGEAAPLPGWTESLDDCRSALDRAVETLPEAGPEAALAELADRPAACHALALALADRRAKRAGRPLHRHLDSDGRREAIPVNATIGDGSPAETAERAREAVAAGFDCLKVKVGARDVADDVARLRAVRSAVGPDAELRADANAAWSREQAREAFAALAEFDVAYVEQPLPPDDLAGHAALRGGSVDVALDETLADLPASEALAADAADVLVLKPMSLGGPRRTVEVARRARESGVTPVVTTTIDGVVARTAAVHAAAAVPCRVACGLATGGLLDADFAPDPSPVEDGRVTVPEADGNGVEGAWSR